MARHPVRPPMGISASPNGLVILDGTVADGSVTSADSPTPPSHEPLLSLAHISRRFGELQALHDVSFLVRAGTVHALLGENGAGKTTLMRIVFGLLTPSDGDAPSSMHWRDAPLIVHSPADALRVGIGMVHQHFTLVPAMTVAENVALGGHGLFDSQHAAAHVRQVAAHAGLALDPEVRVDTLSVGAQQRCEIVKALARDVRLLILDEPTAVLAPAEAKELLAWVRRFADAGNAVVLITHKLRDALAVADDVTVLHRGRRMLSTQAHRTTEMELAAAMLGEADHGTTAPGESPATVSEMPPVLWSGKREIHDTAETHPTGGARMDSDDHRGDARPATPDAVLALHDVTWQDNYGIERVDRASMVVRGGEIVGIAGVEGAGQHELLRLLTGRLTPTRGTVTRPMDVGFVPEDRHRDALLLDAPLYENVALRGAGERRGPLSWPSFRRRTAELLRQFDVRAASADVPVRTLSGGNQQKFVLARELGDTPPALVVENPSRGLDFRATHAVQQALRETRDRGTAVVLYSSDLDEVLALADRVYVVRDGTVAEVPADREAVGHAMLGANTRSGTRADAGVGTSMVSTGTPTGT